MTETNSKQRRAARRRGTAPEDASEPTADDGKERIAKVMARAGLCSRRDAEAWIKEGRVSVNGGTIASPALNVGPADRIAVDGQPIERRQRTRLFHYHKPRGLVTTAKDPEGRQTVFDNLPDELPRVVSVGRLDINTEGLLLLTNDGGLARVLELPSTGWLRRYRVRANGSITQDRLDALKDGITIEGVDYAGIEATVDRAQGANVWLTMGLREGKNREIKKVLEHMGLYVNRLIRLSFGPFQLGELAEGEVGEVSTRVLKEQLGPTLALEAGVEWDDPVTAEVVTRALQSAERPKGDGPRARPERRELSDRPPSRGRVDRDRTQREDAPRPRLDRPKPHARPHVSALRVERPSTGDEPRKRITRASTEDRKGRTVSVERVTVEGKGRHQGEGGTSRNARNFARSRAEAPAPGEWRPQQVGDERRPEAAPGTRTPRAATRTSDGAAKPSGARAGRSGFGSDRPATGRALKDAKSRGPRPSAERPAADRTGRPPRSGETAKRSGPPRSNGTPRPGGKPRGSGGGRSGPRGRE